MLDVNTPRYSCTTVRAECNHDPEVGGCPFSDRKVDEAEDGVVVDGVTDCCSVCWEESSGEGDKNLFFRTRARRCIAYTVER